VVHGELVRPGDQITTWERQDKKKGKRWKVQARNEIKSAEPRTQLSFYPHQC
jgi:hypothetical protein